MSCPQAIMSNDDSKMFDLVVVWYNNVCEQPLIYTLLVYWVAVSDASVSLWMKDKSMAFGGVCDTNPKSQVMFKDMYDMLKARTRSSYSMDIICKPLSHKRPSFLQKSTRPL